MPRCRCTPSRSVSGDSSRESHLAEKEALPIEDFLTGLLTDEIERRKGAAASRRAETAGLDPDSVFER